MATTPIPVTRAEFEEMKVRQAATEAMVRDIHDALMVPQPGKDKSLLDRFASVTDGVEGGTRTAKFVLFCIGALAALGITIRFGVDVSGMKQ